MVHAPFPGVYPRLSAVPSVLHRGLWCQIQKSVFLFRVPAAPLSARAFRHSNAAILAKMIFYHKLCRHPTNQTNKRQRRRGGEASPAFLFEILFPGNRVELFCASALPTLGYRVWFPTPKKEENEERRRNSQTKGMENGSFRYTLILSHLFVFVSNNFLRRWFIPNMDFSSVISSSRILSAFLTAFLAWRNKVFVTASTDAVLMSFRLLFVFPPLLWCVFRHLHRPLFLCA